MMNKLLLMLLLPALACADPQLPQVSRYVAKVINAQDTTTIHEPGASFIRVCFSDVSAPVRVRDPAGIEQYVYAPGQWKRATRRGDETCAMSINGDTAVVEFLGSGKALISGWDVGLEQVTGVIESACSVDDSRPVRCYESSEPEAFERRSPVARITMPSGGLCTAWRVGQGNMMLTNNHCIKTAEDAAGTEVWFNYELPTCLGGTTAEYKVPALEFLATNQTYDFTLFTVPDVPFGWFGLDVSLAQEGERIYMLGHPGAKPKMAMIESDMNATGYCQIDEPHQNGFAVDSDYGYLCDSAGGQSGSPVINYENGRALGIHHLGGCTSAGEGINSGVKMFHIWPFIESFFGGVVPLGSNEVPVVDRPIAKAQVSCVENVCQYNSDGTQADSVLWDFGDQSTSTEWSGTHVYSVPGHKLVSLFATKNTVTEFDSVVVEVTVPGYNYPPKAAFVCLADGLNLECASESYDPENAISEFRWRFRDPVDGVTHHYSTENVSHTYVAAGPDKYVDLTVFDDAGQQSNTAFARYTLEEPDSCGNGICDNGETYQTCPADCEAPPPPPEPILINYSASRVRGPDYDITVNWEGASGPQVDFYRNGSVKQTANDGNEVLRLHKRDKGTTIRVCDALTCSRTITINF